MRVHLLHKRDQDNIDHTIAALSDAGASVVPLPSDNPGHIPHLLDRNDIERLVVSGGDGMIHHTVQALAGSNVAVGIIPAGTGNDIARALAIGKRLPKAAHTALGPTTASDLIRVRDQHGTATWVVSVLTAGFSGTVTQRANRIGWPKGQLKYTIATLACLPKLKTHTLTGLDDGPMRYSLLAVGNTRYFGGGMAVCPGASLTDHRMEVVIVHEVGPAYLAAVLPAAFVGQHVRSSKVDLHSAERLTVETDATWWADGEPLPQKGRVTIETIPEAIHFACGN